jgi:hypothetical protein
MATFFGFMASSAGRAARVVAGLLLMVLGLVLGDLWWILAVVGLIPLLAGVFGVCLLAPLFHEPLRPVKSRHTVAR